MALISEYSCERGSGGLLIDDSGNGNHGTLIQETDWVAGHNSNSSIRNPSWITDGAGVRLSSSLPQPTTSLTIMCWVKNVETFNTYRAAITKSRAGTNDSYAIYSSYDVLNRPHFDIQTTSGNITLDAGSAILADGAWHHLAGTWDGTTARFYVDGVEAANGPLAGSIIYTASDTMLMTSHDWPSESMRDGTIDDIRLYSHALTIAEVTAAMNMPVGPVRFYGLTGTGWDKPLKHVRL